ncbi:Holliday junction resolvase RuvX [Cellulomonas sp. zg-ZUI222]|uniref:Putative pre-16S rRNA nuclease n=1 Tax=Cellulomonas wangleii TaxID=2816956 RepID=A0ABX8D952_9CELL|nr:MULTISPECIES: Holliday junction resolvase RuvX [Cellulomonas]MBO0900381.1 Holliday junction resolvase RuvX [Cellulomonas sp. zg-ZUI22]MBO0922789.1 Holliday junction resolvase RuvX [Cellulomonas wangleii]MBO0926346.1 Holliday junction resolvase RuvX [Cellulomonas wangleii]QVI63969.1 Holliday junction resolvase RuvX [Cellulomonas wangleii]
MPSDRDDRDAVTRAVRLAVDVGSVRVGVASSDPDGTLATPVATLARAAGKPASTAADVAAIAQEARERGADVVYVGLPRHLSGAEGSSAGLARAYAVALAHAVGPVQVRLVDERMSTVSAHQALQAAGRSGRRHRQVVDQAAAVVILQHALDTERSTGRRPGERVEVDPGRSATARRGVAGDGTTTVE